VHVNIQLLAVTHTAKQHENVSRYTSLTGSTDLAHKGRVVNHRFVKEATGSITHGTQFWCCWPFGIWLLDSFNWKVSCTRMQVTVC